MFDNPKRPLELSEGSDPIERKRLRTASGDSAIEFEAFNTPCDLLPAEILELPELMEQLSMTPEVALVEAAKTGHVEALKSLLLQSPDWHLADALVAAATNGQFQVVTRLLHEINDRNAEDKLHVILTEAVAVAAINDHRDIVACLLYNMEIKGEVNKEVAWRVLEEAAANGSLEVVQFVAHYVITTKSDEEGVDKSNAVSRAISGGHAYVVAYLLRYPWNLAYAFMEAIEKEQHLVVEKIYLVYPMYFDGRNLFVDMAGDGFMNAVKYMYEHGHDSCEVVRCAFVKAAVTRRTEVVDFLLGTGYITEAVFDQAYEATASSGSFAAVKFLHDKRLASVQGVYRAFEKSGSAATFTFLYRVGNVPTESLVAAFENVTGIGCETNMPRKEREAIASVLYKEKCIPPDVICTAFAMTTHDLIDMVTALYDDQRIPREVICAALQNAANLGHVKIVGFLMDKPEISQVVKEVAFIGASQNNHNALVQLLGSCGGWPRATLREALEATSNARLKKFLRKSI